MVPKSCRLGHPFSINFDTFSKGGPKDARGALWIDFGTFWDHFGSILGAFWKHFGNILGAFGEHILEIMVRIRSRFRSKSNALF